MEIGDVVVIKETHLDKYGITNENGIYKIMDTSQSRMEVKVLFHEEREWVGEWYNVSKKYFTKLRYEETHKNYFTLPINHLSKGAKEYVKGLLSNELK